MGPASPSLPHRAHRRYRCPSSVVPRVHLWTWKRHSKGLAMVTTVRFLRRRVQRHNVMLDGPRFLHALLARALHENGSRR